jgi:hypothetical protein
VADPVIAGNFPPSILAWVEKPPISGLTGGGQESRMKFHNSAFFLSSVGKKF